MIKNKIILFLWSILALFRVPGRTRAANHAANSAPLRSGSFWKPGEYIENQAQWAQVHLGTKYTMAYGGCGIFAVYNLLLSLEQAADAEQLERLMEAFQKKGAAIGFKFGLSPWAIQRFLREQGLKVSATSKKDEETIDRLGENSESVVVTACNSRKLRDWIHTVCITKDEQGHYLVHNGYHLEQQPDGSRKYCANGPFETLSEAVRHISAKGPVPVLVLGVRR